MTLPALFPYERYKTLAETVTVYYPTGEEALARWIAQTIDKACSALAHLLTVSVPDFEVLLVNAEDWPLVPHSEAEEVATSQPYLTDVTSPSSLVIPLEIDAIFGEMTAEKLAFMLYHSLALACLEEDPRPWPDENPLWADEWQFAFVALWLARNLNHVQGVVNKDLHEQYADIFEPELDGKTPVTIRGFDWFEDTSPEDYLAYELLLEQFAADLLDHYPVELLPRFLTLYRREHTVLLSDQVTDLLIEALGPTARSWLEELVYF
ncbi:MAG: hypothetical protein NVS4B9_26550 [Ktedonobacteraceae bacterium]